MPGDGDPLGIIGTTVDGKYAIQSLAGEGGYSAVYRAEHLVWKEPVAIKFFSLLQDAKPELRETLLEDFIQEGKLMTKLSSRSAAIVQARDIGRLEIDGGWIPFMVLEWLEGRALDQILRDDVVQRLPARDLGATLAILDPVAQALDIAHQAGVAHRDLKPANIVVIGDPRSAGCTVKVLDFGIAKIMAEHSELQDQLQLTGAQITAFTPNYGAPEQFSRNFGATGPWTDVFAMALIAMEMLRGGQRALEGSTFFELGVKSCDATTRPTPARLGIELPPEVEAVFAKAVALHPKDRFASMGDFWAALHHAVYPNAETWGGSRLMAVPNVVATDPSLAPSVQGQVSTEMAPPGFSPATRSALSTSVDGPGVDGSGALAAASSGRKNGAVMAAAIAAIVVVGGGVAWLGTGSGSSETEASPATSAPVELTPTASEEALSPEPIPPEPISPEPASEPAPSSQPAASSEPAPSAQSTAPAPRPGPRSTPPPPAPPTPKPSSKDGTDPFDPNNFGGR